jgi:hypothetical protein
MSQTPATPPAAEPEKPKTIWDRILTSTPIILTIVATLLAGLSSGEMTRAQYFRAVAAQNQSKVSDQWNFFQAKKIRGTDMDGTITVLNALAEPGEITGPILSATVDRIASDFRRSATESEALEKAITAAGTDLGSGRDRLATAAAELKKSTVAKAAQAEEVRNKIIAERTKGEMAGGSLGPLGSDSLPSPGGSTSPPKTILNDLCREINPHFLDALEEVEAGKTERDMRTIGDITEKQIHDAIDRCQASSAEWEASCEATTNLCRRLDKLLKEYAAVARRQERAVRDFEAELVVLPSGDARGVSEVRQTAATLAHTVSDLRRSADDLSRNYQAANLGYTSRRYDREGSFNRYIGDLYELDVRKASLESDRHLARSQHFFNAMLAAQAGVTIATFSLAVRFRSVLWGLATVAGATALTIGGYVYLRM